MRDYARLVVWPRGPVVGTTVGVKKRKGRKALPPAPVTNYRYTIVGMVVTDTPIDGLDGPEFVVDDSFAGELAALLARAVKRAPCTQLGDAVSVLIGLEEV